MERDEHRSDEAEEHAKPERPRATGEPPPPSSQAWAIVAPQLVVRRPKPD
jgi:hypothetical protein